MVHCCTGYWFAERASSLLHEIQVKGMFIIATERTTQLLRLSEGTADCHNLTLRLKTVGQTEHATAAEMLKHPF